MSRRRQKLTAGKVIGLTLSRIDPQVARERMAERDAREAADPRTPAQRWLNDPPPGRSALARVMSGDKTGRFACLSLLDLAATYVRVADENGTAVAARVAGRDLKSRFNQ